MEKAPKFSPGEKLKDERLEKPIFETGNSISYLGVTLEKAENRESQFVADRKLYENYVEDAFTLDMQKNIAISLESGDPMLIEGGTSIGKTTTIRKMCAELGYEVHFVNLTGAIEPEDLMGGYKANKDKKSADDPEYIFKDGEITNGLRQEEGKIKVIILDEYNAAAPNVVIRLHEVLDALERNGKVVLTEDAAESIPVNRSKTKIVALTNPPGKGYFGREPLDSAQLRRWVYQKLPDKLPRESLSTFVQSLAGFDVEEPNIGEEEFLLSNAESLPKEEMKHIEGLSDILTKYEEFHRASQGLLEKRKIAADQPQKFTFDDRMEPARVMSFVRRFYRGDINETFQEALRYYYVGKVHAEGDRKALENLIDHVQYEAPKETKRRGLEGEEPFEQTEKELSDFAKGLPKKIAALEKGGTKKGKEKKEVEVGDMEKFLRDMYKGWRIPEETIKKAETVPIAETPREIEYTKKKSDVDAKKFGEFTVNPETLELSGADFERLEKEGKIKVLELKEFVGKPLAEVGEYLAETYGPQQLPGIEFWQNIIENPATAPAAFKDGNYHFFFGSVLRYSAGAWCVPSASWGGGKFDRHARWLGSVWRSNYRVVLLEI